MAETVKVRIAVAMQPDRTWWAEGHSLYSSEQAKEIALGVYGIQRGTVVYIVTAELSVPDEIPKPQEVAGEVEATDA